MTLRVMADSKAVGTDGLHTDLLKLGLNPDRSILTKPRRLITITWCEGKVPQRWKNAIVMAFTRKKTGQDVEVARGFPSASRSRGVLLTVIATRLVEYCGGKGGFRYQNNKDVFTRSDRP